MRVLEREVDMRTRPWAAYVEALERAMVERTPEAWEAAQAAFDAARRPVAQADDVLVYYRISE